MVESKTKDGSKAEVKVFKDLEEDVINKDMCCACGACVAYCESQSFDVIEIKRLFLNPCHRLMPLPISRL